MCQTCPANESVMATFQCIECLDQLCADCAAFHSRTKLTRDHEVKRYAKKHGDFSNRIRRYQCKHRSRRLDSSILTLTSQTKSLKAMYKSKTSQTKLSLPISAHFNKDDIMNISIHIYTTTFMS